MDAPLPLPRLERLIDDALAEDLSLGDVTGTATVEAASEGRAEAVAKEPLVAAGLELFRRVFLRVDPFVAVHLPVRDGATAEPGAVLAVVEGPLRSILAAERVALNFLQRLCGVATLTRRFVEAVPPDCRARILDTRKTTPGMRALERHAVRCGGGLNHRADLAGGLLIKDNHIAACGGDVALAVRRALAAAGPTQRVEVEVTSLEQLDDALAAGARAVLLDNMTTDRMAEAVRRTAGRAVLEASGGVRLDRIPDIARTGVDFISVGALTHSAAAVDVSLEVRP